VKKRGLRLHEGGICDWFQKKAEERQRGSGRKHEKRRPVDGRRVQALKKVSHNSTNEGGVLGAVGGKTGKTRGRRLGEKEGRQLEGRRPRVSGDSAFGDNQGWGGVV